MNKHYVQWALMLLITMGSVMALSVSDVSFDTQYGYLWRGLNHTVSADVEGETSSLNRYAVNGVYTDVFNLPLWSYLLNSTHVEGLTHNVTHNYTLIHAYRPVVYSDYSIYPTNLNTLTFPRTDYFGVRIHIGLEDVYITSFAYNNGATPATKGYILDSSKNVLTSVNLVGGVATFSPRYQLINDTTYYLVVDNDGLSYDSYNTGITTTFPKVHFALNETGTLRGSTDTVLTAHRISSVILESLDNYTSTTISNDSLLFNGVGDYLRTSKIISSGSFTISTYLTPLEGSRDQTIFHGITGYVGSSKQPVLQFNELNKIRFGFRDTSGTNIFLLSDSLVIGTTYHVVITYNHLTGEAVLYVDNISHDSVTLTNPIYYGVGDAIFGVNSNFLSTSYFNGKIHSMNIYNRVLSTHEISYSYDEVNYVTTSSSFSLIPPYNYNSTHIYDTNYLSQYPYYSYNFNGINQYVLLPMNFMDSYNSEFSISFWYNIYQYRSQDVLFDCEGRIATISMISNKILFNIYDGSSNKNILSDSISHTSNTWNHITAIYNGSHILMYINNILQSNILSSTTPDASQNRNCVIGGRYQLDTRFLNGNIQQFQIFNKTLSAEEVSLLYQGNSQFYGMANERGDNITATVYATNLTHTTSSSVTEELTNLWVNVTARGYLLNETINNFSGYVSDQYGNTINYNTTTGNYTAIFNLPSNITSNIYATGYATNIGTIITTNLLTNPSYDLQHELYETNTAFIYLRDEATNLIITEMINVSIMGDSYSQDFNTSTGILPVTLNSGNYMITVSGGVYESRTYNIEIVDNESVIISVYLSRNAETTTFTFIDDFTNQVIEGVSFTISRLINNVWTVVQTKESDISGKTTFTYTPNVRYFFTAQKTGYEDKTFELNPILFSQYDVRMQRSAMDDYQDESTGINIYISPSQFREAQNNYFIIQIYSPGGRLNNYNYNITYPGGSNAGSGTNAYGEMFTHTFNITSATIHDRVVLRYTYTAGGETFTKTKSWTIIQARIKGTGFMNLEDPTFGLGIATRVLIAVGIMIIVAGVAGMIAGWVPSLVLALLLQSLFMMTGFIEPWVGWLSLVVGFIVVMGVSRSG